MVGQPQAHVVSSHPCLPIEDIAASEVEEGERVLFHRVMLDIDPVVLCLKEAHAHIGRTAHLTERTRLGQALSDKPLAL